MTNRPAREYARMFTGIVECVGTVTATRVVPEGRYLRVSFGPAADECEPGMSVCVSGVCLTVSGAAAQTLEFDVIRETLQKSTLGS
ncbi:MAG: hypothetical protein IIA54_03240, partial [Chloroflexi bacterium]|nr:hypothetical protein [Chloroflexota bacterium]